jgi:RNA polymerase sigma factor (sigma-70 family)
MKGGKRKMAESLCEPVSAGAQTENWSESAFQRFFLLHYSRVAAILLRILGQRALAEEMANDLFWKIYRDQRLPPEGNVASWLYRAAANAGIDALRADARRRRYEREAGEQSARAGHASDPLEKALDAERRAGVRAALAAIKPVQAQVLLLRASGFSYKELAEALGLKPGSVGTTLVRAQAAFRECYLAMHGEQSPANKEEK